MEIKRNIKDSIFTHLFSIPKYKKELYLLLHPDDIDVKDEDIKTETIENVLATGVYNDLGLLVRDKLIVLIEAQSSWSKNILVRMLVYIAETYKKLWTTNHYNIYGTKKIQLPKPEFYVVYTGEKIIEEEYLSINREFFCGKSKDFELKVKIIQNKQKIKLYNNNNFQIRKNYEIINEYIIFIKTYDEARKKEENKKEAILKAIDKCIKGNILKEYLLKNKMNVMSIMDLLYDQDFILSAGKESLWKTVWHNVKKSVW